MEIPHPTDHFDDRILPQSLLNSTVIFVSMSWVLQCYQFLSMLVMYSWILKEKSFWRKYIEKYKQLKHKNPEAWAEEAAAVASGGKCMEKIEVCLETMFGLCLSKQYKQVESSILNLGSIQEVGSVSAKHNMKKIVHYLVDYPEERHQCRLCSVLHDIHRASFAKACVFQFVNLAILSLGKFHTVHTECLLKSCSSVSSSTLGIDSQSSAAFVLRSKHHLHYDQYSHSSVGRICQTPSCSEANGKKCLWLSKVDQTKRFNSLHTTDVHILPIRNSLHHLLLQR